MQRVALECLLFLVLVGTGSQANAQSLANPLASIMSLSPTSGQGTCRMETGAAHDFCGLPYELSNFQGGILGAQQLPVQNSRPDETAWISQQHIITAALYAHQVCSKWPKQYDAPGASRCSAVFLIQCLSVPD
jgi:hypothetical protein